MTQITKKLTNEIMRELLIDALFSIRVQNEKQLKTSLSQILRKHHVEVTNDGLEYSEFVDQ